MFLRTNYTLIILALIFLSSCSYIPKPSFIQNRDKAYLSAQNLPPMKVPPGLDSSEFQNYYPIPYRSYPQRYKDVSILPPGAEND